MNVTITVNGEERVVDLAGAESLLTVLRNDLDLPGTKDACEQGGCAEGRGGVARKTQRMSGGAEGRDIALREESRNRRPTPTAPR